jgi:hypothetical protein
MKIVAKPVYVSKRTAENYIRLGPAMDFAAVRAGKLLRSNFGRTPEFFFNCLAGIGQLRRRWTPHQQAFHVHECGFYPSPRRFKIKSPRHVRVDKRSALWRCRKATFAFSRGRQR